MSQVKCRECNGSGWSEQDHQCRFCQGSGEIVETLAYNSRLYIDEYDGIGIDQMEVLDRTLWDKVKIYVRITLASAMYRVRSILKRG